jgi:thiol-disulfide isomerase/thioredoxin
VTGLVVLVVTLLLAGAAGLVMRARSGQVRAAAPVPAAAAAGVSGAEATPEAPSALVAQLDALGVERGERLTLLQFSSTFCAPCRATRTLLADVAATAPGVQHVEIDVADGDAELELVRSLDIRRTPTTVILDGAGSELARASGVPRREQVLALVAPAQPSRAADR